ncbi:oxidoreductase [Mycolicibacterium fortuitum]|uniref:Oxidoreductase n=1 Tax=Mycolicibacterium fortuitum TaxID=1766 RepID=A0ABD6QJ01_MYCFO|nr:SDR family oxidoreductase [Mycolicibacterium fortuitum]OMC39570.1 oxidoreductase [Mycolicibacterium fortuitum]
MPTSNDNWVTDMFDMSDRVVIVTGGTRGIGLALAEGYATCGAKVVVASRNAEACTATEKHLRSFGVDALGVPTQMSDLAALSELVRRSVDAFGRIDVVVNNAATALAQPVGSFTPQAWQKVFDTNLRGPVFLAQEALPYLKQSNQASILNIISASAFTFVDGMSLYASTKAALAAYTRSAATELAPFKIRVNSLAPGAVNTDMIRANTPERQEWFSQSMLMKRLGDPREIVGPALLMTSAAGSFITGQTLCVDGGTVAH